MDFDDPPEPPEGLDGDYLAASGSVFPSMIAPRPFSERARQRAVANLSIFQGYSSTAKSRRPTNPPLTFESPLPPPPVEPSSSTSSSTTTPKSSSTVSIASFASTSDSTLLANNMAVLESLSLEAKERFGTAVSRVSIMDRGSQRFVAGGKDAGLVLDRDSKFLGCNIDSSLTSLLTVTACSHAILQASTAADRGDKSDGMVILDFDKDWRFRQNNFGEQKFYASAPIYSKPALGDGETPQPIGLFCLLDPQPRMEFSSEDRKALVDIADRAGEEIRRLEEIQVRVELDRLRAERENWRNTTKERRTRISLPRVEEFEKPDEFDDYVAKQLATTPVQDSAFDRVAYTTVAPVFARKLSRPGAVSAIPRRSLPSTDPSKIASIEESNGIIDLATRLVSETLELDFVYFVSIDTRRKDPSGSSPVRIISSFNFPIPPPLFDANLHLQLLSDEKGSNQCILFVDPDFTATDASPSYSTGVITRVSHAKKGPNGENGVLHLLAGFSEESEKIIKRQDIAWMLGFARDLQKYV